MSFSLSLNTNFFLVLFKQLCATEPCNRVFSGLCFHSLPLPLILAFFQRIYATNDILYYTGSPFHVRV